MPTSRARSATWLVPHRVPGDEDVTLGRPEQAVEVADERGLARAVLADDRHATARGDGQRHTDQRARAVRIDEAEVFGREVDAVDGSDVMATALAPRQAGGDDCRRSATSAGGSNSPLIEGRIGEDVCRRAARRRSRHR